MTKGDVSLPDVHLTVCTVILIMHVSYEYENPTSCLL